MPRKSLPVLALLADFQQACAELGVGWYLFGAQAALLYGSPRLTADADLTVQLGGLPTHALVQARPFRSWDEVDVVRGVGPARLRLLQQATELDP